MPAQVAKPIMRCVLSSVVAPSSCCSCSRARARAAGRRTASHRGVVGWVGPGRRPGPGVRRRSRKRRRRERRRRERRRQCSGSGSEVAAVQWGRRCGKAFLPVSARPAPPHRRGPSLFSACRTTAASWEAGLDQVADRAFHARPSQLWMKTARQRGRAAQSTSVGRQQERLGGAAQLRRMQPIGAGLEVAQGFLSRSGAPHDTSSPVFRHYGDHVPQTAPVLPPVLPGGMWGDATAAAVPPRCTRAREWRRRQHRHTSGRWRQWRRWAS